MWASFCDRQRDDKAEGRLCYILERIFKLPFEWGIRAEPYIPPKAHDYLHARGSLLGVCGPLISTSDDIKLGAWELVQTIGISSTIIPGQADRSEGLIFDLSSNYVYLFLLGRARRASLWFRVEQIQTISTDGSQEIGRRPRWRHGAGKHYVCVARCYIFNCFCWLVSSNTA